MNILPKNLEACPVCGETKGTTEACRSYCVRLRTDEFVDATTQTEKPEPHRHVQCAACGFVWLVAIEDRETFDTVW